MKPRVCRCALRVRGVTYHTNALQKEIGRWEGKMRKGFAFYKKATFPSRQEVRHAQSA